MNVVRTVDELGRVALPIELRTALDINEKDQLDIFAEGNKIILQKHMPACFVCNSTNGIQGYNEKPLYGELTVN